MFINIIRLKFVSDNIKDNSMFSALTNSNKMSIGEGLGGWSGHRGMRNQIKKESIGMFTKRKVKVGDVQDYTLEAARRMDLIGDEFGSPIVKFTRGKDYQIEGGVDYGTSTAALGPLGKPLLYLNDNVTGGVRSVSEPGSRQSVFNIPLGMASIGKESFATIDQTRIIKGPVKGVINDEILNVNVQPTHVYMTKQTASPFNVPVNSSVKDKTNISIQVPLYSSSMIKQEATSNVPVSSSIRDKINVSAHTQHSDPLYYVPHSYNEKSVKLQNAQPKGRFMPVAQIEKDNRTKNESYTLRNPRLSLSGFEVKAPYFLKH